MNDNKPKPPMSPFGEALFNCFKSPSPQEQLRALKQLNRKMEKSL